MREIREWLAQVARPQLLQAAGRSFSDALVVDALQAAEGVFQRGDLGLGLLPVVLESRRSFRLAGRGAVKQGQQDELAPAPVLVRAGTADAAQFLPLPWGSRLGHGANLRDLMTQG